MLAVGWVRGWGWGGGEGEDVRASICFLGHTSVFCTTDISTWERPGGLGGVARKGGGGGSDGGGWGGGVEPDAVWVRWVFSFPFFFFFFFSAIDVM